MKRNHRKYFGNFGGAFVPELLMAPLNELDEGRKYFLNLPSFKKQLQDLLENFAGRPTSLTAATSFSKAIKGPRIFLKREDLLHTGAHKINNALGQCLLAKEMGKTRIVAETGAGQHGLATATTCAKLGLECHIYMGEVDIQRQLVNVQKMRLLGASVHSVSSGDKTLKEAVNESMRDWAHHYETTHYCLGSALGPYPYPQMVIDFHKIIGIEAKRQLKKMAGQDPSAVVACVGGGSNAMGIFHPFIKDNQVALIGVEAGGRGIKANEHAARFQGGSPGVLHGSYTYLLQDKWGQIQHTHSISAGLDYPAISPALSDLYEKKRAHFFAVEDHEVIETFDLFSKTEGIIPALESTHALAYMKREAKRFKKTDVVLVNLSGRGDKDLETLFKLRKYV
ncbi:MAG: Tryptophan synthase beta chain [Chlamydiae bacterium]|nr:Tryptophan synthase beta chain [Chlamydiota bacterium]